MTRRLAAILAADIVGWSAVMLQTAKARFTAWEGVLNVPAPVRHGNALPRAGVSN